MAGLWQPHVVSFSSGGVRVLGHVGVLAALIEAGMTGAIQEWWGCSGGALCALLGALGVSAAWLRDCVEALDLRLLGGVEEEMVADYFQTWGVNSGRGWIAYVGRVLETWEPGVATWTFADLAAARPGVRFCVIATNLTRGCLDVFSATTTPDVRLLDALRASCAVPFFYTPWISASGEVFCDGAVVEQFPWKGIGDKAGTLVVVCSDTALGRRPVTGPIAGITDYVGRIYQAARRRCGEDVTPVRNWIAVNNRTVGVLDFGLDAAGRRALFEEGLRAGRGWLTFRRQNHRPEPSERSSCSPPECGDPGSDGTSPCEGNRTSGSHPLHMVGGDPCPSLRPDTGTPRAGRRWSL
jgi:predicted acylesterase/phospholipase RssA